MGLGFQGVVWLRLVPGFYLPGLRGGGILPEAGRPPDLSSFYGAQGLVWLAEPAQGYPNYKHWK